MTPGPRPLPTRRRRRLALSLRGLMVLVLFIGGVLGWQARRASIQRRAVAVIEAAGGAVVRDYQHIDRHRMTMAYNLTVPPPGPRWLHRWLGPEYLGEVTMVHARSGARQPPGSRPSPVAVMAAVATLDHLLVLDASFVPADDADLAPLAGHRSLGMVVLQGPRLTDAALATLATLPRLEDVTVTSHHDQLTGVGLAPLLANRRLRSIAIRGIRQIESRDLAPLARLDRLEELSLDRSPPTDDWLARLPAPGRLTWLHVPNTAVTDATLSRFDQLGLLTLDGRHLTDASLARLGRLTTLTQLELGEAPAVTDVGLAHLAAAPNLAGLRIGRSRITGQRPAGMVPPAVAMPKLGLLDLKCAPLEDAALGEFATWPNLNILWLTDVPITDEALARIGSSPRLRMLNVSGTKVTPAGVARLGAARPTLDVFSGPSRLP